MQNVLLSAMVAAFLFSPTMLANASSGGPNVAELKLVAQLPAELPQRVSSIAYDGEKLWVAIYLGRGRYATLDPSTLEWQISKSEEQHKAIKTVAGAFESPGGICFANGKLWVGGSYGETFGAIDTKSWNVEQLFRVKQRDDGDTQTYAGMAFDGSNVWIAWHWLKYRLPDSQTQLLLKVEPYTGNVIASYPLPPGTRNDMVHGLTWDGARLWHIKDNLLSSIDPATGVVSAQYKLDQIKRASGLAWDGQALWIAEFDGKVWRLPF